MLNQTRPADEVIIVDDGSNDDGVQLAASIASGHGNVRFLSKSNGGQSSARNLGVKNTQADLVAFLDQDDWWYPEHLEELEKAAMKLDPADFGWVYSDVDEYDVKGGLVTRNMLGRMQTEHPKRTLHNALWADMYVVPSAALVSRTAIDAIGGFDERLRGYEDDDLFIRLFHAGFTNDYVDRPLSGWRIHHGSTSYSPVMARSAVLYAQKLLETFPDDVPRSRYYARDLIAPRFFRHAVENYKNAARSRDGDSISSAIQGIDRLIPYMRRKRRSRYRLIRPFLMSLPHAALTSWRTKTYLIRTFLGH